MNDDPEPAPSHVAVEQQSMIASSSGDSRGQARPAGPPGRKSLFISYTPMIWCTVTEE